ncbi:hypothetical protein PACTADRAFT_1308 [Pachysolen tannophilus NRRL Y-2460]|uniref:U4/U6.U5 small nuclear ribonucleoprotein 27kDa protein domain-containing protein n=1 Tax=Pachysolen tannophilus NRRL Y-2460 TaxID=669874 RepID=A0A1E4TY85_PACTA|nr:hypothetical protein PACTADRAFT_1308 [Pachysolen tannophilus NRRL Y-2460]
MGPKKIQINLKDRKRERSVDGEGDKGRSSFRERSPALADRKKEADEEENDDDDGVDDKHEQEIIEGKQEVEEESRGRTSKRQEYNDSDGDDISIQEDPSIHDMASLMGFNGFGTTKNKKVEGTNVYGSVKNKKAEYRQYMNRKNGFNRPLSPPSKRKKSV